MIIVRYKWCGVKSVYAEDLNRKEAGQKLRDVRDRWVELGCVAEFTSPGVVEISDCPNVNDEGEYRIRPDDWPIVDGEPQ